MAKTLSELKTLVLEPTDLQEAIGDDSFVSEAEITRYINQGIKQAEAEIQSIYVDYFLHDYDLDLVDGTSEYVLPTDIYAHKIRRILHDDGSSRYEIKRIRDLMDTIEIEDEDDYYSYLLVNDPAGIKLRIYPTPQADLNGAIKIWYLRDATQLENDADEIDIPEFYNFVVLYARHEILKKDIGNPMIVMTKQELERERQLMVDTLHNRIPDLDSKILLDTSFYDDYYRNYWDY